MKGESIMSASIVLLDRSGVVSKKIGHKVTLPPGYEVPEGCCLSWELHFMDVSCKIEAAILTHGKAKIFLEPVITSLVARIESPVAKDFLEAIELTTRYVGGKVATFDLLPNTCSFVLGVVSDLKRLYQSFNNGWQRLRQRIGFKIAK